MLTRVLVAAAALLMAPPALAAGDSGPEASAAAADSARRSPLIAPALLDARAFSSLDFETFDLLAAERDALLLAAAPDTGGPSLPEPDHQRIRARRKRFKTRYRMQERTFGVAIQPSWAMLQGSVVGDSFENGFGFTARFIAQISPANQLFIDIGYSRHDMRNPRGMFFRTAVTDNSGFSGQLEVWNPALYFAFTFPVGASARRKPMFIPKTYVGMGPMYTFAKGKVTNSGSKGTVTGHGTQPFIQFTPGIGMDVRILDFYFVGLEFRERITLPTKRPSQTAEFSIPKLYVFETALNFSYMFW